LITITDEFSGNLASLQESLGFFFENKFRNLIRCPLVMHPTKLLFLEIREEAGNLFCHFCASSPSNPLSDYYEGDQSSGFVCLGKGLSTLANFHKS
jgi:hypothetical protein